MTVRKTNAYRVLGLPRSATAADIRSAYRRLALKHHPDRNGGAEEATRRFQEVQAACETLSDPAKRQGLDARLDRARAKAALRRERARRARADEPVASRQPTGMIILGHEPPRVRPERMATPLPLFTMAERLTRGQPKPDRVAWLLIGGLGDLLVHLARRT